MASKVLENQRQRAPSKRSLETKSRILNAAEAVFSERGFDGASIRDIANRAQVNVALVQHHGGTKDALFFHVVARKAEQLAILRTDALIRRKRHGPLSLRDVLSCFITPFLERVLQGDPSWRAYGRLIAHVSADARWHEITEKCFDPTVAVFLEELAVVLPSVSRQQLGAGFVFTVSAMLSLCASRWRIDAMAQPQSDDNLVQTLLDFCEAGFARAAARPR
tara:strand:- start:281 stop:943 length:663 start_codon:yes stop_codon:yes gene_type:complete